MKFDIFHCSYCNRKIRQKYDKRAGLNIIVSKMRQNLPTFAKKFETSTVPKQELRSSCFFSYIGDHPRGGDSPMDGDHSRNVKVLGMMTLQA